MIETEIKIFADALHGIQDVLAWIAIVLTAGVVARVFGGKR